MKTSISRNFLVLVVFILTIYPVQGQLTSINHNSTRSNHFTALHATDPEWVFGIFSGAGTALKGNESNLFRGNGFSGRLSGDYFFGRLGIGITSGFVSGNLNQKQIDAFILERQFIQSRSQVRSEPFNAYLLGGPSVRIGNRIQLIASVKGGLFFNQVGRMSISPEGASRILYGFESSKDQMQFGLSGGLSLLFDIGKGAAIMLSTDLMQTNTQVQLLDISQGIDIPVTENRNSRVLTSGITLVKKFGTGHGSPDRQNKLGLSQTGSGTRVINQQPISQTRNKTRETNDIGINEPGVNRAAQGNNRGYVVGKGGVARINSQPSGGGSSGPVIQSLLPPQHQVAIKSKGTGADPLRVAKEPCGTVTKKKTHPDGTIEELTFSCPDDAAAYTQKIDGGMPNRNSMNVTVPRQTQGATFGERVNAGLRKATNGEPNVVNTIIISGRVIRTSGSAGKSIISNSSIGGASSASYASTGMALTSDNHGSGQFGPAINLYSRDRPSGMASGKRQYQPVFFEGQNPGDVCNPCLVQVSNPVYSDKGGERSNPLYTGSQKTVSGAGQDCDGITSNLRVYLIDQASGTVLATTHTNVCGEYWFANVPNGVYALQIEGEITIEKSFLTVISGPQSQDLVIQALTAPEQWQHVVNSNNSRAGSGKISMSDLSLVIADDDNDGLADRIHASSRLTDGSISDLSSGAGMRSGGGKANMQDFHFSLARAGNQSSGGGKVSLNDLHITKANDAYKVFASFSNGSKHDITQLINIIQIPGLLQLNMQLADTDNDGVADLVWNPRSNLGASALGTKVSMSEINVTKASDSRSYYMRIAPGDLDGDGTAGFLIGNHAQSDQAGGAGFRPGNPIGGLTIKAGRNPAGSNVAAGRTNELGEFEIQELVPGQYTISIETTYQIAETVSIEI